VKTKTRVVAFKLEAVEGTPETLTAADAGILVSNVKWTPDIKMLKRDIMLPTLSKLQDIPGMSLAKVSFRAELIGCDGAFAAGNLPQLSPYLRACGFAETLDVTPGAETVTYAPASTGVPCGTMGIYNGEVVKTLSGARGTVKISANNGEATFLDFEFMGAYVAPIDGATLTPTYSGLLPPKMLNANFLIDAYAPVLKTWSIDMGNKLAPREDLNSVSGYKSFDLTDRDPRGNFDPEMTLIAEHAWYDLWKAGTLGVLSIGPVGVAQYNKFSIGAPGLAYTKVSEGEREGLEVANTDFQLSMGSGDDEVWIEFS
jgi:hypothetical protein